MFHEIIKDILTYEGFEVSQSFLEIGSEMPQQNGSHI